MSNTTKTVLEKSFSNRQVLFLRYLTWTLVDLTVSLEHRISGYLKSSESLDKKVIHIFSTWFVLFASKFVMLWVLQILFGDAIVFAGAYHGVITFIVLVVTILLVEYLVLRLFEKLA